MTTQHGLKPILDILDALHACTTLAELDTLWNGQSPTWKRQLSTSDYRLVQDHAAEIVKRLTIGELANGS